MTFKSTTSPQSEKTYQLVRHLRSDVLPPLYQGTPNTIYTYGDTAINVDFAKVLSRKMPLFIAVVVGLSFVLLALAFRSLVVPLTAAVMNLLAAGGSFGVSVAIFQWGWGSDGFGAGPGAPLDAWIPVMLFAILFGLSMDYQVFLVSRMHEEWVRTKDNERAVTFGQAETGGIITAAAIIMIAVFLGFIVSPGRTIKIFGTGLAIAVFLDAFVLRTMLVPALMHLFGKRNWYFPRWLRSRRTAGVGRAAGDPGESRRAGVRDQRPLAERSSGASALGRARPPRPRRWAACRSAGCRRLRRRRTAARRATRTASR